MMLYAENVRNIVQNYGGVPVSLERNLMVLEGDAKPILSIVQFPTMQDAKAFYESAEYAPLKQLRMDSTQGGFLALAEAIDLEVY